MRKKTLFVYVLLCIILVTAATMVADRGLRTTCQRYLRAAPTRADSLALLPLRECRAERTAILRGGR